MRVIDFCDAFFCNLVGIHTMVLCVVYAEILMNNIIHLKIRFRFMLQRCLSEIIYFALCDHVVEVAYVYGTYAFVSILWKSLF